MTTHRILCSSIASVLTIAVLSAPTNVAAQNAAATTLPEVVVTAEMPSSSPPPYAGGQVARGARAGFLGNLDYMESPFATTSFTEEFIRSRVITDVRDVLALDPSANLNQGRASFGGSVDIRGFPTGDIRLNGLRGLTDFDLQSDAYERVEIIKGPTALLDGSFGGLGGTVNLATKRATDQPFARFTSRYISDGIVGGNIDLSRRFGKNLEFGVRSNLTYSEGDATVQDTFSRSILGSIGLDYRGEKLRASVDVIWQQNFLRGFHQSTTSDSTASVVPDPRDVREGVENYRVATSNRQHKTDDLIAMTRVEYDLFENTTISLGYGQGWYDYRSTFPQFQGLDEATGRENYSESIGPFSQRQSSGEALIRTKFDTGPVKHTATLGYTDVRNSRFFGVYQDGTFTLDPDDRGRGGPGLSFRSGRGELGSRLKEQSIGLADNISAFDDRFRVILGVRHQRVGTKSYDGGKFVEDSETDDEAWTGAGGLIVRPIQWLSLYGNYIQGLEQGPTVPQEAGSTEDGQLIRYENAGQTFAPTVTEQFEVGFKLDFGRIGASVSFYQITRPFIIDLETSPTTLRQSEDGEQRNRGIDVTVFGEPWKGLRLTGGVSYLQAELQGTAGGLLDGNRADGVPEWSGVLAAEWDVPVLKGLTLLGNVTAKSRQYTTPDNDQEIRSYGIVDLGARYTLPTKYPVVIQALLTNVADEQYWSTASFGFLEYGEPRTLRLQASTTF